MKKYLNFMCGLAPKAVILCGLAFVGTAQADMSGSWVLVFNDSSSIVVTLEENNGSLSGIVQQYNQPVRGAAYRDGFVFYRSGGGLNVPQFFGGKVDGDNMYGAFCHDHTDCSKTFKGIKN